MTAPTRATAAARISAAYAAQDPREHTAQRLAASFRHDPQYERLAGLRADPPKWAALSQGDRLAVAHYLAARTAAESLGHDTSAPA